MIILYLLFHYITKKKGSIMTLNQLYYFKKLAELQHFSKSASELYISQPSLSYSIKNLEKELGTSLFQKKGRNVVLTNHGSEFYNCVVEVLTKLEDGVAMLKHNIDNASNKICIGTIPIFPVNFITKNIRTYMKYFPQTTFDIFTCIENIEVINGINDGVYDLGFCFKEKNESDLVFVPMLRRELVVISKVGHELSKKERLLLSDIKAYPIITYRESNPLGVFIRNLFNEEKIVPNIIFTFDDGITISEMVAQDFGIAVLTNIPILKNYLSIIPLDLKSDSPILYLVYNKNSNRSKAIQNFVRLLKMSATIT